MPVSSKKQLSKKKRKEMRQRRTAMALTCIALLLLTAIVFGMQGDNAPDDPVRLVQAVVDDDRPEIVQLPEETQPTPAPTLVPTPEPMPVQTSTPQPTNVPTPVPESEPFTYLPVFKSAKTDQKRIAVTVDDCYQPENLRIIMETAYQNNQSRLTLFPIGANLSLAGMEGLLKTAVFKLGYEIENHTYDHARIFRMSEAEMAQQIFKHNEALNKLLGVNYHEHIFRCMGGDGLTDQRTHNYLEQLGYLGFAQWSYSGSNAEIDAIKGQLKPGAVFLFHTTNEDTAKLQEFIPYAAAQGYELVTLNELFGLPANEISEYKPESMPIPRPYADDYATQKKGDYTYKTVRLQEKLVAQGYLKLDEPPTGYYGDQTAQAVAAFQRANGLSETGEADETTQRLLLSK